MFSCHRTGATAAADRLVGGFLLFALSLALTGCGSAASSSPGAPGASGGRDSESIAAPTPSASPTSSCPASAITPGHFGAGPALLTGGGYDSATLLLDGKVLFVGGGTPLGRAEIYDPCTNQFAFTGSMHEGRLSPLAFLLPGGKVLVYGGASPGCCATPAGSMEIYDPLTGLFTSLGDPLGNQYSYAALLSGGRVLFAGGDADSGPANVLYDPIANHATPIAHAMVCPVCFGGTATVLSGGSKVLFTHGSSDSPTVGLTTAEVFDRDLDGGTFTATAGSLHEGRRNASAIRLSDADGTVLVVGGEGNSGMIASAEVYHPTTGLFAVTVGSMGTAREFATVVLLANGQVLVAGGYGPAGAAAALSTAEVYSPVPGTFASTANSMTISGAGRVVGYTLTATLLPSNGMVLLVTKDGANLYQPQP